MKFVIKKSFFKNFFAGAEEIEKARKGEQASNHKYIFRKETGKKERPYVYIFLEDLLKKPVAMLESFFNVKEKDIDDSYNKLDIKKDFGADKKTFAQHILEYFSHRAVWDKRFADKATREKWNKPVKMQDSEKISDKGVETPEPKDDQLSLFDNIKEKPEWKANPSLMRKIWGMYTGKAVEQQEKQAAVANKKIEKVEQKEAVKQAENTPSGTLENWFMDNEAVYFEQSENDPETLQIWRKLNSGNNVMLGNMNRSDDGSVHIVTSYSFFNDWTNSKAKMKEYYNLVKPVEEKKPEISVGYEKYFDHSKADQKITAAQADFVKNKLVELGYNAKHNPIFDNTDSYFDVWERLRNYVKENELDSIFSQLNNPVEPEETEAEKPENAPATAGIYSDETKEKNAKWIKDLEADNAKITAENDQRLKKFNDFVKGSKAAKWVIDHARPETPFNTPKEMIVSGNAEPNFVIDQTGFNGAIPYNMATKLDKELKGGNDYFSYKDDNGNLVVENFNLIRPKYVGEGYKISYQRRVFDTQASIDAARKIANGEDFEIPESAAEAHANRSQAMMGNQNAKKYGLSQTDMVVLNHLIKTNSENGEINWNSFDQAMGEAIREGNSKIQQKIINHLRDYTGKKQISLDEVHNAINEIYNEEKAGNENETNGSNNNIGSDRISGNSTDLLSGSGEENSNSNVPETESGSNGGNFVQQPRELGIGSRSATTEFGSAGTGRVTAKKAKAIREQCLEILKKPNDQITDADKAVLAQYEGAGGTHEGDNSAKAVLTEFYTPRDVIKKVWELVDKYNPNQNKTALEPSCGIGRFAEGRNEKFTMCEWDETSARIAKILHPEADVRQGAFQEGMGFVKNNAVIKNYKGEKYDCAVGNPPYMEYKDFYSGLGEGKVHTRYEQYFMDRTLDTLKDGGIMAFVVPASFLRSGNSKAKEVIASKGKLLEAWRLPKGTFSSTDVGTDIVVIRKEPGNIDDFNNNKYFSENENHVIGHEADTTDRFGKPAKIINLPEGKTVEEAIQMIDVNATTPDYVAEVNEVVEAKESEPETKAVPDNLKFGDPIDTPKGKGEVNGFVKEGGKVTGYLTTINGEPVKVMIESEAEKHANRSEAMKGNKNAEKLVHKERAKKAKKGDIFVESTGKNMTADEFNKKYSKNIPEKDMPYWKVTDWEGYIDTTKLTSDQIQELENNSNFTKDFTGKYINVANYASGNIYEKLNQLESYKNLIDEKTYETNKAILEKALPAVKKIDQFTISPLANFAKEYKDENGFNLVDQFLKWVGFNEYGNMPYGRTSPVSSSDLEDGMSLHDIYDYCMMKPVVANKREYDDDSETAKMFAEQKKRDRRDTTERLFNQWLRQLPETDVQAIESKWNSMFNTYVNPDFTKIPLFVEGMNENKGSKKFDMTPQQIKGVSELCNKGNGILAYDVGVGKTVTGIVATVNQIQTGKAKKPLICVPKAVYKKWIKEIHQHFPQLQVNELSNFNDKDLGKFKDKDGNIKLPDGALNICTYEALQKVTFKKETINSELRDDMLDSQSVYDYDAETGEKVEDTRSEREQAKADEKLNKLLGMAAEAKEGAVYWEDLGIDHITVDELHNFKNIFSIPRTLGKSVRKTDEKKKDIWGRTVKNDDDVGKVSNEYTGISGASSKRGMKLYAIAQLIQRKTNGRGFFGLSATPFNNSPVEIYNILSLVARNRLKDLHIYNLQDFMKNFAEMKPDWKVKANGDVESAQVMKNFKNLTALQNLITEFIDKVDGEEAGVVRPYKRVHKPELDLTPLQQAIMNAERDRMDGKFSTGDKDADSAQALIAMNNMRMCTLSPSLIDPKFYADYENYEGFHVPLPQDVVAESPKLRFVCDSVVKQFKERPTEGQVIYMPRGVGGKKAKGDEEDNYTDNVQGFEEMKKYLMKQGMPEDSIAFMRASTTLDEKERINSDFNDPNGKIKVIIGSETIKEGVSLNGNSTTLYNTMLGWNPTETIQVEGRIWRQGNKQGITHIVYPLMNDSIDAMMYQKYDEKSSRLNALWSYKGDSLNVEDINPEEMKFELIKDPQKRANMQILQEQADLKKTKKLLNASYDSLTKQRNEYRRISERIEEFEKDRIPAYEEALKQSKESVEWSKKQLAEAKKSKDPEKIKKAERDYQELKDQDDRNKSQYRLNMNNYKKAKEQCESYLRIWEKLGVVGGISGVEPKLQAISAQRQDVEKQMGEIESRREFYVDEAKKKIKAEQEKQVHLSIQDQVDHYTTEIGNDLRPMDDDLRAEIKAGLEARKVKPVQKSIFIIHNGRFLIRKTF